MQKTQTSLWYAAVKDKYGEAYRAVIVGKGPSLDKLRDDAFRHTDIVFCVNEAALRAGPVASRCGAEWFLVQQDAKLGGKCIPPVLTTTPTTALVSVNAMHGIITSLSNDVLGFVKLVPYTPKYFKCDETTLTAVVAVKIARHIGLRRFKFLAFDSWNDPAALGYFSGAVFPASSPESGGASRFLLHKALILKACEGCEVEND